GAVGAEQCDATAGHGAPPGAADGGEIALGRAGLEGGDLLQAARAAHAGGDDLVARRAVRRGNEDAIEPAGAPLRGLRPPLLQRRLLSGAARVLALEDLLPVVPAVHLPQVH